MYRKFDYWTCKDLIEICNSGKINPEDKLQLKENDYFNNYLNNIARKKLKWAYIPEQLTIVEIKQRSDVQFRS